MLFQFSVFVHDNVHYANLIKIFVIETCIREIFQPPAPQNITSACMKMKVAQKCTSTFWATFMQMSASDGEIPSESGDSLDCNFSPGNFLDKSLKHIARSDFHEVSGTVGNHVFHSLCPLYR